jgi:CheY-like chemotaxis protein
VVLMAPITELEQAAAASDNLYLDGLAAKPLTPAGMHEAVTRAYVGDTHSIEPAPTKSRPSLRGMRLLVAEDNALNQEVIYQVLTRAGAEVVMANNGQEAVDAVRKPGAVFDAVLMDLQMPILDGYGATRVIREELGLLDLPIIAVTAFVRPEDREHAQRAGMVGFIAKPLDVDQLLDVLMRESKGPWSDDAPPADASKAIEVLDMNAALSAFGGDKLKYHALLQQFIERHGDDAFEAQRRFDANDAEAAKGLVHGLNGMASILKADQLAMLAIATESALWDGNSATVQGLFQALQSAMGALSESVKNLA